MYTHHFELSSEPFGLTPDPSFLYPSAGHREALAALHVGISGARGLIVMVGEVGTGKTTLLYSLLSAMSDDIKVAYISNSKLGFDQILRQALADFGVAPDTTAAEDTRKRFTDFLLRCAEEQRIAALVIDEAQNLDDECMECLRLLSNVETFTHKLLQIVLVGQPELTAKLSSSHLRQMRERIAVYAEIKPLSWRESYAYVAHRLEQAGGSTDLFTRPALAWLLWKAGGIPRRINILCHNALLFAFGREAQRVTFGMARKASKARLQRNLLSWKAGLAAYRRWKQPSTPPIRDRQADNRQESPPPGLEELTPPRPFAVSPRPLTMSVYLLLIAGVVGAAWWNSAPVILRPEVSAAAGTTGARVWKDDPFAADEIELEDANSTAPDAGADSDLTVAAVGTTNEGEGVDGEPSLTDPIDVASIDRGEPPAEPPAPSTDIAAVDETAHDEPIAGRASVDEPEQERAVAGDAPADAERMRMMRVEQGSNVWEMTRATYGHVDPQLVARVLEVNPRLSSNPDHLKIGDILIFPPLAAMREVGTGSAVGDRSSTKE